MGRNDLCFCGSGLKQKKCHCDINENSLAADAIRLYSNLDKELNEELYSKTMPLCSKGCYECCSQYFTISEVEFAIIMEFLVRNKGFDATKEIVKIGLENNKKFQEKEPQYYNQLEKNITGMKQDQFFEITMRNMPLNQSTPCIFLDEECKCSIYPVRPIICRTHGLCYNMQMLQDYKLCSNISSLIKNKENMLCIDKYTSMINNIHVYKANEKSMPIYRRQYPIFYYMKIYFQDKIDLNNYFNHPVIHNILHGTRQQLYDLICNLNGICKNKI